MKNFIGLLIFVLLASHIAWKQWGRDSASSDLTTTQIQTLAASVKAEEVVMYSTTVRESKFGTNARVNVGMSGLPSNLELKLLRAYP